MTERSSLPPVAPGDVLAGKYHVDRVLGAGGMGVVVEARHVELDQRVALKFLLPNAITSPQATARFLREARAAARIRSEHVARVTDVGRLENGAPYIVMEFLDGTDLSVVVREGPLPLEDAVDFVLQACEAMAEAHAAGIVHRDLKPANLFLTRRPGGVNYIKVLDFGISKMTDAGAHEVGLTQTAALIGSPLYMSPEQLRSARSVDHRTDIWSLGVILFELLTGRQPFTASTLPQLIATILADPPPLLRSRRVDLPLELDSVVNKALAKEPNDRYADVGQLARALAEFAGERSRHTLAQIALMTSGRTSMTRAELPTSPLQRPVPIANPPPAGPALGGATHAVWSGTQSGRPRASRRWPVMAAGLAAVITAGGFGAWWAAHSSKAGVATGTALPATMMATAGGPPTSAMVALSGKPISSIPLTATPGLSRTSSSTAASGPSVSASPRWRRLDAPNAPAPNRPTAASSPITGARTTDLPISTPTASSAPLAAPKNPFIVDIK